MLIGCTVQAAAAQSAGRLDASAEQRESLTTPPKESRARIALAAGFAIVRVRQLPPRDDVGQGTLSIFVSAAYLWTPSLVTQVEITSQAESFNWDFAHQRVVGRPASITLKHNYTVSRRTVAQLVQFGQRRLRPYLGAGIGIESQTTYDTWYEGGVVLKPDAETVDELPGERRSTANHVMVFGEAGAKMFLGSRAYVLFDWKYAGYGKGRGLLGVGVQWP